MTNDANGKMIHYPVHGLSKITEGPKTAEFRGRMKKTVMCCISVDDDTIGTLSSFSLTISSCTIKNVCDLISAIAINSWSRGRIFLAALHGWSHLGSAVFSTDCTRGMAATIQCHITLGTIRVMASCTWQCGSEEMS